MSIEINLKNKIIDAVRPLGLELSLNDVIIENSKDPSHGDYASNVALKFASKLGKSPRDFASYISENINKDEIDHIEIAGPGFINFFIKKDAINTVVSKILKEDENYGRSPRNGVKVNVEFVSANPTGILHVGTARGAAIGDCISRLLDAAGYDVTREYYINDAGAQITNLGLSIQARYMNLFGIEKEIPADGYAGPDIYQIAEQIKNEIGDKALKMTDSLEFFKERGMEIELNRIIKDLELFRVKHDVFTSEKKIRSGGAVEKELEFLKQYTYVDGGAVLLKTSDFLDDKDRVIVKSNGDYTYFLPDIVYHVNKMSRGFDKLIDVLGADHHGYINRMKSALMMHGYKDDTLDIELVQMVRFLKDGKEYKASKRSGDAITLRDVCEEVGVDAMRYFFAMRAPSSHMDFDMDLAKEESSNNPVYYAQYAHARLAKVLLTANDIKIDEKATLLKEKSEIDLLKLLIDFPKVVNNAAIKHTPHLVTTYIYSLAAAVHAFYGECRVIDRDHLDVTSSRLALVKASKIVLRNALSVIGVSAPDKM